MIVTNVPSCYGLLRRILDPHEIGSFVSHVTFRRKSSQLSDAGTTLELTKQPRSKRGSKVGPHVTGSESTEKITQEDPRLQIWQQKQFAVEDSSVQEGFWSSNPSNLQHPSSQATAKGSSSIDFGRDDRIDDGRIV